MPTSRSDPPRSFTPGAFTFTSHQEGAFDEAVKGVDAIAHTASPFHMRADDPDELIIPAVRGTTGILASARAHAPGVQRIVVTSSCASVLTPLTEPRLFSEEDWNEASVARVRAEGRVAPAVEKYRASKTLAERAAWAFWEEAKAAGAVGWDLVVLNPPFVFGPAMNDVASPAALSESSRDWFNTVVRSTRDNVALATVGWVLSLATWGDGQD